LDTSNLPDIEEIYASYLEIQNEINRKVRYKGKEKYYHASSSGMCMRKHYYSSIDETVTNPSDKKGQRVMRLGTVVHEDVQEAFAILKNKPNINKEWLKDKESSKEKENINSVLDTLYKNLYKYYDGIKQIKMEEEIILEEFGVRGFYDLVIEMETGEVYLYDIKTIGSYGYKLKFGRNPRTNDQDYQEMQLGTYGLAIKEEFGRLDGMFLFYYNKDSSMMKQKIVPMTYLMKATRYWKQLNAKMNGGMPPIQDGISPVMDWECNYCNWKDTCFSGDRR